MDLNQMIFKYGVYCPVVYLKMQNVPKYLREYKRTQNFAIKDIENIQLQKLKHLVEYAGKHVEKHKKNGLNSIKLNSLDDIALLPLTTKEMLKHEFENLKSNKFKMVTKKTTGGSTGEPVIIHKNTDAMARELAATWRGYSWANIDIGDRQARFWGVPFGKKDVYKSMLIDFVCNRRRCSAFSFTEQDLNEFTKVLNRFKPQYFYGYVSMLCDYASYIINSGEKLEFRLKSIITTSEVLTPVHRKMLENTFKTKVYNEYGCGELGSVAHECEYGALHIMAENMIVEVLDNERVCSPGEEGELVITELNNFALPLIRYRMGDYGSISTEICKCGRSLPIIRNIAGRAYDTIENYQGKKFHGEFFMYIIEEAKRKGLGIDAFQVIQKDLKQLEFKIVVGHGYSSESEYYIKTRILETFDPNAIVDIIKVEKIDREPSGKLRVVVGCKK